MSVVRHLKAVLDAKDNASPTLKKFSGALKVLGGVAAAVGAYSLGRKLVDGAVAAAKAAGVQEAAEVKLAQAIRNTGGSVSELLPRYKAMAAHLQDLTGVGDEVILNYQAQLVALGKLSGKGLERATKAALDLAAAQGMDLKAAFDLVAKAAAGYTATLSRYGIILDESVPKEQKFEAALKMIEARFGGQAQAHLKTFSGRLQELKARWGDLLEKIGKVFDDPTMKRAIALLADQIKQLTASLDEHKMHALAVGVVKSFAWIAKSVVWLGEAFHNTAALAAAFYHTVGTAMYGGTLTKAGTWFYEQLQKDLNSMQEWYNRASDLAAKIEKLKREILSSPPPEQAPEQAAPQPTAGPAEGMRQAAEAAQEVKQAQDEITVSAQAWGVTLSDIINKWIEDGSRATEAWLNHMKEAGAHIRALSEEFNISMRDLAARATFGLADALASAAFTGRAAFKRFFHDLMRWLAQAIAKAIILRVILSFGGKFGQAIGSFLNATGGTSSYLGEGVQGSRGVVVGAAGGWRVPGTDMGRDTVPAVLRPGEAVLPAELTEYLMQAAVGGGAAGAPVEVHLHGSLATLVDEVSVGVRDGSLRLVASETATTRIVR